MKPIAIFQHYPGAGPGHFLEFAKNNHLPVRIYCGFLGEALPATMQGFSGLISMGGPMSVNDKLDFMEQEARLMEEALRLEIPIMGHCLGSQLLARALGAEVSANRPVSFELGWYPVEVVQTDLSDWTEGFQGDEVFHWHNENFALPAGAVRLLSNQHCTNQAFLHGIHLGMQFHIEITAAQVKDWTQSSDDPQNWAHLESVQSQEEMYRMLEERVSRSNRMADQIYHRWSLGLIKD